MASNQQTIAYQLEKVTPTINELFIQDHLLFDRIEKGKNLERISSRAMRVPLDLVPPGAFSQIDPDGGSLGRGSAIVSDYGQVTSVYFAHALEWTALMEAATDEKDKAVADAVKRNVTAAIESMRKGIEALLNSDSTASGTLDTVSSVSGTAVTVTNANQFMGNQVIDVWTALGGTKRGSFTVFTVDGANNIIYAAGTLPSGTTANDLLLVHGSSAVANTSLGSVNTYLNSSSTGTFLQLARSSYQGMLTTPYVNGSNATITPQLVRLLQARVRANSGINTPEIDNALWYLGQDQEAAWENLALNVQWINMPQLGGTASEDMLKKTPPKTMADRPSLVSLNATPGRVNMLCLNHWGRAETQKLGPYDVGGQTVFPAYASDGSVDTAMLSYLWAGFQIYLDNPRAGGYSDTLLKPTGY